MSDVLFLAFSALVLLAFCFPSPLWVHAIHRNSGPLCLLVWVFVIVAIGLINGLVWHGDDKERALGWCDFAQAVKYASPTALCISHFVLAVYIVRVLRTTRRCFTPRDRRIHSIHDCLLAIGLPVVVMALHPVYQPSRFAIHRTTGCQPTLELTLPAVFLGLLYAPVISAFGLLASCTFTGQDKLGAALTLLIAYIAWCTIRYRRHIDQLASPCELFYSPRWFLRLSVLVILLGPVCFICSLVICLQQFRAAGPYVTHFQSDRSFIEHDPDVSRVGALEVFPVVVGAITVVLLGPGAETAAVASRFGDILGLRAAFDTTRRRWSEHRRHSRLDSSYAPRGDDETQEYIEPEAMITDVDSLRPVTQTSGLMPPHFVRGSSSNTLTTFDGTRRVSSADPIPPPPSPSSLTQRPSFFSQKSGAPSMAMAGLRPLPKARTVAPRVSCHPAATSASR